MIFVWFWFLWTVNIILCVFVIRLSRALRRNAKQMREMRDATTAAVIFANALADRDVRIPCDDCGNDLGPTDQISVIPRPNGTVYVGHTSHQRHIDWGKG